MSSVATLANNTILHIRKLLRAEHKSYQHKKQNSATTYNNGC